MRQTGVWRVLKYGGRKNAVKKLNFYFKRNFSICHIRMPLAGNIKLNILPKTFFFMHRPSILILLLLSVFSNIHSQTGASPDTSLRIFEKVEVDFEKYKLDK